MRYLLGLILLLVCNLFSLTRSATADTVATAATQTQTPNTKQAKKTDPKHPTNPAEHIPQKDHEPLALMALHQFDGSWRGTFDVYAADGKHVRQLKVHQTYWWEGKVQHGRFVEMDRQGKKSTATAKNFLKNGQLVCQVIKNNKQHTEHLGRLTGNNIFWFRKEAQTVESFREHVEKTPDGVIYFIEGFGIYGQGEAAQQFLFIGRYRRLRPDGRFE